jgi:hypothetical protein
MATMMEQVPPPTDEPQALLRRYGRSDDDAIDLAAAALALAALGRPDTALTPYRRHLQTLATDRRGGGEDEGLDLAARIHPSTRCCSMTTATPATARPTTISAMPT